MTTIQKKRWNGLFKSVSAIGRPRSNASWLASAEMMRKDARLCHSILATSAAVIRSAFR